MLLKQYLGLKAEKVYLRHDAFWYYNIGNEETLISLRTKQRIVFNPDVPLSEQLGVRQFPFEIRNEQGWIIYRETERDNMLQYIGGNNRVDRYCYRVNRKGQPTHVRTIYSRSAIYANQSWRRIVGNTYDDDVTTALFGLRPVLRQAAATIAATHDLTVQPLEMPLGQIFYLDYQYNPVVAENVTRRGQENLEVLMIDRLTQ